MLGGMAGCCAGGSLAWCAGTRRSPPRTGPTARLWPPPVRAGPAFGPRRAARTWLEPITGRDQSSCSAACSLSSRITWSLSQTPALFQALRRRQQVMPEPKPSSWGRYSHWMPVCSTNKIPHKAWRSGTRGRPGFSFGPRYRQQRLNRPPQFIRDDPRTRLPLSHGQTNEHPSRQAHLDRLRQDL